MQKEITQGVLATHVQQSNLQGIVTPCAVSTNPATIINGTASMNPSIRIRNAVVMFHNIIKNNVVATFLSTTVSSAAAMYHKHITLAAVNIVLNTPVKDAVLISPATTISQNASHSVVSHSVSHHVSHNANLSASLKVATKSDYSFVLFCQIG